MTHSIVMENFEEDGIYTTTCDLVEVGSLNIMDFNNFKRMPEQRWYRSLHGNKAIAKIKQVVATSIDGVTEDVPDHFRDIYSNLYSSVNDVENMTKVSNDVEKSINHVDINDVMKVTPSVVKGAAGKL